MPEGKNNLIGTVGTGNSVLPLAEFKKALGPAATKHTDTELERIRDTFDRIADLTFNEWVRKRNAVRV